jgi:hypothetical protein
MQAFRARVTRPGSLSAFVVCFFFLSHGIPSFHSCFPLADGDLSWERLGASASHGRRSHAPAPREDGDHGNGLDDEGACLACLLGARPKCMLTPAGVSAPVTAQLQPMLREATSIPAPADLWSQILPRGPPANAPS